MGLDSVSSGYGLDFWQTRQNAADNATAWASSSSYKASGSSAKNAYAGTSDMVSTLSAAIKNAMSTLKLDSNDRVTFATLNEARAKMEADFTAKVKDDLKKLDVDEDIQFRLVTNNKGGVDVISNHPDVKKIEKYLADNPDMVKAFQNIQAMSNIEEARKVSGHDIKAMRSRIQVESMVDWFAGTGQGVQQLMQYSNMDAAYSAAGINKVA